MSTLDRLYSHARERLERIRANVRDWKAGTISAPEAVARIARIVDVELVEELPASIEPTDPRLMPRRVVKREPAFHGGQYVYLDCGHVITQIVRDDAERMRCAQCVNELIDERRRK